MKDLNNPSTKISMSKSKEYLIHYQLLIWKNFLLRKRRPGLLIAEILVPLMIPIILVGIRTESPPVHENTCHIRSTNLPTMGLLSYLQSIVCNFLYRCHSIDPDISSQQYNYTSFGNLLENISAIVEELLDKNVTNNFQHLNLSNFIKFIKNSNDLTQQRFINVILNFQRIYQDLFDEFTSNDQTTSETGENSNHLHNKTIDFGIFNITVKQIQWFSSLSRFICGTKTANLNDIGKLIEFLKEVDFSNIFDIEKKLKRIRRSSSSLLATLNNSESIENVYKINCLALDSLLRHSLLVHYTGRLRFLLNGYIFYHPVNQWTNEIIYRAIEPQRLLILLKDTLKQYQAQTKPHLDRWLSNTSVLVEVTKSLKLCATPTNKTKALPEKIRNLCLNILTWLNPEYNMNSQLNQTDSLSANKLIIYNRINSIIDILIQLLDCFPLAANVYGVNNQSNFHFYMNLFKSQIHPIVQGILFNNTQSLSNNNDVNNNDTFSLQQGQSTIVTIRQSPYLIDETNDFKVLDHTWHPKPRNSLYGGDTKYLTSGYLDMQDLISNAIIELSNNLPERMIRLMHSWNTSSSTSSSSSPSSSSPSTSLANLLLIGKQMKFFPTSCYTQDVFLNKITKLLPQLLLLTWILSAMLITKFIVEEKENSMKEFTRIMGITNVIHWLSWFTSILLIGLPITLIMTFTLKFGNIFLLSNVLIIFLLFFSYLISIIMFCFLCSTLFHKANLSAIVTGLLYFIIYIPTPLILANEKWIREDVIIFACLSNQVAFCLGLYALIRSESQGFGSQWYDLWYPKLSDSLFSPGKSILMLWIDSLIYLCMTLLIEWIISKKFNLHQLIYERFKCQRTKPKEASNSFTSDEAGNVQRCVELNTECLPISISVENLSKIYTKGGKPVLNQLNVNFYANQITSLLGHNGAGKSTLISILTGMHKPTKGSAFICGYNIENQMNTIRTNLGFCPQHNILFDYLTVIEHIEFYAKLKGFTKEQIKREVEYFSKLLGLTHKLNDQVKNLSGGQKRKLSIAIAFVGRASVILLDEPTTGVDPYSRRSIWDLILKVKLNKTIIITTHHMDEADILGDRIAIISQGKLKCYGSSLFLKSNYGQGYYLILERQNQLSDENSLESFRTDTLEEEDFEYIMNYLKQFIQGISLINFSQNELVYRIPLQNVIDGSLSQMLNQFERQSSDTDKITLPIELSSRGILSCGLTDTSLEEIFLTMADDPATLSSISLDSFSPSCDQSTITNQNDMNSCETNENKNYTSSITEIPKKSKKFTYIKLRKSQMNCLQQSYRLSHLTDGGRIPAPSTSFSVNRKHYFRTTTTMPKSNESHSNVKSPENIQLNQPKPGQQMKAVFIKRFHYTKRSKLNIFIEFILPICVLILALSSSQLFNKTSFYQPMIISPWLMLDEKIEQPLNTFYENNLYEFEDPMENLLNKSNLFKSALNIAWEYESALKKPYGWTGIGCLPKEILKSTNKHYKLFGQCDLSNMKIIKNELTRSEMQYIRSIQSTQCTCKSSSSSSPSSSSCSMDSFTQFKQQPSSKILPTKDIFSNLTSFKVSDYLVRTQNQFIRQRYGGLSYHTLNYPYFRTISKYLLHPINPLIVSLTNATSSYDSTVNLTKKDTFWSDLVTFLRLSLPPISYFRIWFNNKGYAAAPAYLNSLHNLQARMLTNHQIGLTERNLSPSIIFINHPLSIPKEQKKLGLPAELLFDLTLSLFTLLSLSFIPASFTSFLVKEHQTGSKHLQFVSGLNPFIYWLSAYLWDILNYTVCAFMCILIFVIFQKSAYINSDVIGSLILLIIFYGLAIIPMLYLATFFIHSSSTALVILSIFNLLIGSITCMCTLILDDFSRNNSSLELINNALKILFTIFPQYCLSRGLFDLASRYYTMKFIRQITMNIKQSPITSKTIITDPFDWNILGNKLCALPIEACLFFMLVLLKEHNFFIQSIKFYFYKHYPKLLQAHNMLFMKKLARIQSLNHYYHQNKIMIDNNDSEDEDVRAERQRITKADELGLINSLCSVAVINLTKFFPLKKKPSVNSLTFAVRPGECFGLLGVNGAGKTTTFNMITGKLHPSMGTVYVNGFNVVTQTKNAHKNLGYCPQFDAVHDLLTGRETLSLYARLRGFPEEQIPITVSELLQNMGLSPYADRIASAYSGGNRRKLSTAIAIIGKPQVILLDEPTSGMDPVGKRFMWDQIIALVKEGRSVILTTHSMEECEALCQQIGIMINGKLKCFGSSQHLKNRFGNGYRVEIRLNHLTTDDEVNKLKIEFHAKFPNSTLNELQSRYYEYQMDKQVQLSALFTFLNEMQANHAIEYYSVKQTTLDQVFVNFSRNQMNETENGDNIQLTN
ncbi:unnamed protein product [Schistosoma turkestanicum]|nr:unnamed protein product [Schistosoma turkestanicum]